MQANDWRTGSDEGLDRLFAAARRELSDDEFTAAVMKPILQGARRRRVRAGAIGASLVAGVSLAAGPLVELATFVRAAAHALPWRDADAIRAALVAATEMYRTPVFAVLVCALAWPVLVRWVAR
jgi:hypothetical protein